MKRFFGFNGGEMVKKIVMLSGNVKILAMFLFPRPLNSFYNEIKVHTPSFMNHRRF